MDVFVLLCAITEVVCDLQASCKGFKILSDIRTIKWCRDRGIT